MQPPPDFRGRLERLAPVSDATWQRLQSYARHLVHWQGTLNLVAPGTVASLWERHILDSWQLLPSVAAPEATGPLLDLGSGAGLPGLILAIAGLSDIHLVEANHRKAAFLRFVAAETGTACTVHACRIEALSVEASGTASAVTARALAPLSALLDLALPFCGPGTLLVFPKGRRWREELAAACAAYSFEAHVRESVTEAGAVILELRCLARRT